MQIGSVLFPHGLFLGPMAGYTDFAMRTVCREMGAEGLVTEMVSAKAVVFGDRKTIPLARVSAEECPCAVQLFGHEPEVLAEAARIVAAGVGGGVAPTMIDLNMGCPVHKIVSGGDGSALMRDPALAERIVRAVRDAVKIPVTVKIRLGWDDAHRNAPEVARAAESGGADAVFVHGRTRTQFYAGTADYRGIGEVVRAVSLPVIGNGDVRDAEGGARLLRESGCAGIMVGRGAVGNPFLFRTLAALLSGQPLPPPPTAAEKYAVAKRQLTLAAKEKGESVAVLEARKHLGEYLRGIRGGSAARAEIFRAESAGEMLRILAAALSVPPDPDGEI
ncbi:MAG: tRNA dihydrouridine synthase DusB [Eubacteriales bacterium]|nr:tRNA dihydrouridine synthase DusB [Eubacteriales bacterium]